MRQAKREPIPAVEAQAPIEAQFKSDVFKADLAAAVRVPEQAALARRLLAEAQKPDTDATTVYVLLRLAEKTGVSGGDADTVFAAIEKLADRFQIQRMTERVEAVEALAASAMPTAHRRDLIEKGMALAEQCVDADNLDQAGKALNSLRTSLARIHDPHLAKQFEAILSEVQQLESQWQAVRPAWKKLRVQPRDPEANQAVGQYLCFHKDSWYRGLPKLARGTDPQLKKLAQDDLAGPETPEAVGGG